MKFSKSFIAGCLVSHMMATAVFAAGMHPETGEALADDQTFTYRVLDEHSSVDPQLVEDITGSEVIRDLFEGLFNQDAEGNLVPGVALSFEVNDSKDVYTFKLRDNAKWSNGDPVTASDFVYGWQRLVDPDLASPYAWFGELMSIENVTAVLAGEKPVTDLGAKALDPTTLQVSLSTSLPYFPLMTTHTSTFPTHKATIETHGSDWTNPENIVSNGAYILSEHLMNERSVRIRNDMYWNNDKTIIEKVVALVINDENVALTRYLAGELDRTEMPAGQYPTLSAQYPDEAVSFPSLCSYYYTINLTDSTPAALKDKRVRQALSLAIDRDIIVEKVLAAGQFAAYTFTPEATAGFQVPVVEAATMTQAQRDAKAKALMAEAGYADGLDVELLYNTSEAHKKVAVAVSQMWKTKLGVNVALANQEWKVYLENRSNQDYQVARAGWCGDYNEASTFLDLLQSKSGYNDAKYSNAMVDSLLKDAKTAANPQSNYTKIEEMIAQDVPIIPIYHYTDAYMMGSDVGNWPVNNVEQNWYSRDLYKKAD